jgi:hypothetical protein
MDVEEFFPTWYGYKNSIVAKIGLSAFTTIHKQPFSLYYCGVFFYCIGLVTPNHILYSCCIYIGPWSAGMTSSIILVVDISEFSAPPSDVLHCHNAITLHLYQLALNFNGGECFAHTNQILLWTSAQDQVSNVIAGVDQLLFWIESHCCAICCMSPLLQVLLPAKK